MVRRWGTQHRLEVNSRRTHEKCLAVSSPGNNQLAKSVLLVEQTMGTSFTANGLEEDLGISAANMFSMKEIPAYTVGAETDAPSDIAEGEDDGSDGSFELMDIGDTDGNIHIDDTDFNEDQSFNKRNGKRKSRAKTGASPFASLEEYGHLLKEAVDGS
ncbi:hypothetical protein AQUCO_00900371v1 [Aquilegia coerulea]|uniref:Uncharacterized protein n=1 Tax=Aquilegia coerulea TaxID=218851 RepID=A0A2G5EDE6_AQUCA|nr:hypothetical protein AQUCO_00900371v1 [Aquilegia coerulea]